MMVASSWGTNTPPCPVHRDTTVERKGHSAAETEWVFSCHQLQSSPPDQLLIASVAQRMLILAANMAGVKCGKGRRGGRVQSSLQKQPASTVEERTLVFTDASRSAVTWGKPSSTVLSAPHAHGTVGGTCQQSQPPSQNSFDWVG